MRNASALGNAARARSVHDAIQIRTIGGNWIHGVFPAEFEQLLVSDDLDVGVALLERVDLISGAEDTLLVHNDGLDVGRLERAAGERG